VSLFRRRPKPTNPHNIEVLVDHRLIEQDKRTVSLSGRELRWALRSRQGLIGAFGLALLTIVALVFALDGLTPTVRLVPLMVEVHPDGTTHAEPLMSMMPADVQEAGLRATLWLYVQLREGYSFDSRQYRYDTVMAMSEKHVGEQYAGWFNYGNPDSPQTKYSKNGGVIDVKYESGDFNEGDPQTYRVTYKQYLKVPGSPIVESRHIAFVHFKQVTAIPLADRVTFNPNAIKVSGYPPPSDIGKSPTPTG
jgi:type IV secretion system protein VirB8